MGGRGGTSGLYGGFSGGSNKWDYRGNDQRISQLSNALSGARSASKINAVAQSLRVLDKNITAEIGRVQSGAEKDGSLSALLTQRRKVRQLMQKAGF